MKISLRKNENICLVLGWMHYDVGGMHIIDHVCQRVRMTKCADGAEIKLEYLTVATTIPEQLLTMIKVKNNGARVRTMLSGCYRTSFLDMGLEIKALTHASISKKCLNFAVN